MNEKTLSKKTVFEGKLLTIEALDVELADGTRSIREIVRHPGAIGVLAQLPDGDFVFVRQFRKPMEEVVTEIVAGTLEQGEEPDACAARELKEETGFDVDTLTKLGVIYPAPGYTAEKLHLYHAALRPEQGESHPEDDEKIEVVTYASARVEEMIRANEIHDAKTLAAWMLWERNEGNRSGPRR